MSSQNPRYSPEETARRGQEIYAQQIRALVEPDHRGEVVAIDIETGAYAIGKNAIETSKLLRAQLPEAEIFFVRVGARAYLRIGGSSRQTNT